MPTRFQLHCQTWKDGCGSEYCAVAMKKTFYRGDLPCDILFIGEAPGKGEDKTGQPFSKGAPAGSLLEQIVKRSIPAGKYRVGFTNVVACIPRLPGEEKLEPDFEQISACKPRLEEIIEIANPRLIIAVGKQAEGALEQGYLHSTKIPEGVLVGSIVHPAWIMRQSMAFRGIEVQNQCCAIRDYLYALENPPTDLKLKKLPLGFDAPPFTDAPKKGLKQRTNNTPKPNSGMINPSGKADWAPYDPYADNEYDNPPF